MVSKEILNSHPVTTLRKEVAKTNIKGYSKLKKADLIVLMMKTPDRFKHIKLAEAKQPTGSKSRKGEKPIRAPPRKPLDIPDDRKKFSFDPSKVKRNGGTLTYLDKNVFVNGRVFKDHFFLDLFKSRMDLDKPRAERGEAHHDLCSILKMLVKKGELKKDDMIKLKAGDITRGERRFSMKKLVEYYQSIGFKVIPGEKTRRTVGMEQPISNFLRVCGSKFKL